MSTASPNRPGYHRTALLLLAVAIVIAGFAGLVEFRTAEPGAGPLTGTGNVPGSPAEPAAPEDPAERLFLAARGATDSRSHDYIASAFDREALREVSIRYIQCRGRICKVALAANPGDNVRTQLAQALAESFNAMVTIHSGTGNDQEKLLYVEIPSGH